MRLSIVFVIVISFGYINAIEVFSSMANLRHTLTYVRDSDINDQITNYIKQRWRMLEIQKLFTRVSTGLSLRSAFNMERPLDALQYAFLANSARILQEVNMVKTSYLRGEVKRFRMNLPTSNDIVGISRAIIAAQELHDLPTKKLAKGWFGDRQSRSLIFREVLDIARSIQAMDLHRRYNKLAVANRTLEWLLSAKDLIVQQEQAMFLYKPFLDVLKSMKCDCSVFGYRLFNNLQKYHSMMTVPKNCSEIQPERCIVFTQNNAKGYPYNVFEAMCRGESVASSIDEEYVTHKRSLRCLYVDNNDPRLILQPLKVEELNRNHPNIVVIHDVINDNEARTLMSTRDDLKPGHKMKYDKTIVETRRHAQWYRLEDNLNGRRLRDKLRGILSAFTKLHPGSFDDESVLNFGSVAMEQLHLDTILPTMDKAYPNEAKTNLLTAIIYLNDVEEGGEEVFPFLGTKVKPIKNGALLFTNLYKNGNVDMFSLHGSCPIMRGEKWTIHQWVKNHGQEFSYPCSLDKFE